MLAVVMGVVRMVPGNNTPPSHSDGTEARRCRRGHPQTPENVYVVKSGRFKGKSRCRLCTLITNERWAARHPEQRSQYYQQYYEEHRGELSEKRRSKKRQEKQHETD